MGDLLMPSVVWPLQKGRPKVEIVLTLAVGGQKVTRVLLADTGAGSDQALFELVLDEDDCLLCHSSVMGRLQLHGAYSGAHPVYGVRVQIPQLGFDEEIEVVGVPKTPIGLHGIAGFRFLNRFTYGNFGDAGQFGIES